jgi:ArsR family transcriptional regulator
MEEIIRQFKAFSDETRLRVLHLLLKGELCICELMEVLELTQSKVSRHMAYLKNAGLVKDRREGVWVYYSLTGPKNKIHASQLRCLAECFEDDEVLKRDTARVMTLRQEKTQTSSVSEESPEELPIELL